jgi:hypothetical protein
MAFENLDVDDEFDELDELDVDEGLLAEESSNRMFLIIAGVLGGIALLALICIAVYALVLLPQSRSAQAEQKATVDAQNTEVASIIAETSTAAALRAIEAAYTPTPTETSIPASPTFTTTPTSVVAMPSTGEAGTLSPQMATATALHATLTANALLYEATLTARPQATAIPDTGFADDVGLPALMGLAGLLIVIIFLARRLRTA